MRYSLTILRVMIVGAVGSALGVTILCVVLDWSLTAALFGGISALWIQDGARDWDGR